MKWFFSLALLLCMAIPAFAQPNAHRLQEVTCRVRSAQGTGTGVVVGLTQDSIIVLTCQHVVDRMYPDSIVLAGFENEAACQFFCKGYESTYIRSQVIWRGNTQAGSKVTIRDAAILKVPRAQLPPERTPKPMPLGIGLPAEGASVINVGCADGAWPTLLDIRVTKGTPTAPGHFCTFPPPKAGRSGGPIFDVDGERILGLINVSHGEGSADARGGVISSPFILAMLKESGIVQQLAEQPTPGENIALTQWCGSGNCGSSGSYSYNVPGASGQGQYQANSPCGPGGCPLPPPTNWGWQQQNQAPSPAVPDLGNVIVEVEGNSAKNDCSQCLADFNRLLQASEARTVDNMGQVFQTVGRQVIAEELEKSKAVDEEEVPAEGEGFDFTMVWWVIGVLALGIGGIVLFAGVFLIVAMIPSSAGSKPKAGRARRRR